METIRKAIEDEGYEDVCTTEDDLGYESAREEHNKVRLQLEGLSTPQDIQLIKVSLATLPGVTLVQLDDTGAIAEVAYDPDRTWTRCFIEVIEQTNSLGLFKAKLHANSGEGGLDRRREIQDSRNIFCMSCVFTVPLFLLSMVTYIPRNMEWPNKKIVHVFTIGGLLRLILSLPPQFVVRRRFYVGAYKALQNGSANMDVLVALGINGAHLYSLYMVVQALTSPSFKGTDLFVTSGISVEILISYIFLGKYLLALAKGKTSEAISKLMDLAPATTTLLTLDDQGIVVQEREISSQLIQRRDIIKVHIKMKFPLDHPLLELSFNSMGLFIMNCSPMILHWLVCIQYQIFYPIVVHDWR